MWPTFFIPAAEVGEPVNQLYLAVVKFAGTVYVYVLELGPDLNSLDTATLSADSLFIGDRVDNAYGIYISPDGTRMYISGIDVGGPHRVLQYALATAWKPSTGSYVGEIDLSADFSVARGIVLKPDGTELYIAVQMGSGEDRIRQYTFGTAWDITSVSFTTSGGIVGTNFLAWDFHITSDGADLFVTGERGTTDDVRRYTMSTPWLASSLSYSGARLQVTAQDLNPRGLTFSSDASKMYMAGDFNNAVFQYTLATPGILATATYDNKKWDLDDNGSLGVAFALVLRQA